MTEAPMDCTNVRKHLLDHLYGALDDEVEAALDAHLAGCAECRSALERAEADRAVLASASRTAGEELRFSPPAPGPWWGRVLRIPRRARNWATPRVAAAALLLLVGGVLGARALERDAALAAHPRIVIAGPRVLLPGTGAAYSVTVTDVDGDPLPARVVAFLPKRPPVEAVTDASGRAEVRIADALVLPGERAEVGFEVNREGRISPIRTSVSVVDGRRLLARITTDRPLYRPGETVLLRAVVLDRVHLSPAGTVSYRYRLLGPKGDVVAEGDGQAADGVGAGSVNIPAGAPGGEYRIVIEDSMGRFAAEERALLVQDYRPPRVRGDLELDRDSYGPGAKGILRARIGRIEGGVPEGATVDAILTVDGRECSRTTHALPATGLLAVPFEIPSGPMGGSANLALLVRDGGVVESLVKGVPIPLDRLVVEMFPEGGDLVAGLPSRIYFRARDPARQPADLEADLVDEEGRVAATLRVDTLGMGSFDLTPARGRAYRLAPRSPSGIRIEGNLPPVRERGTTLRALGEAVPEGAAIPLEVASTEAGDYVLSAWCRGVLVGEARVRLAAGASRRVDIRPTTAMAGVVRVTMLDPAGLPRAERLVAVAPGRRVDLRVRTTPAVASPGDRVRVDVETLDERGRPIPAFLGASVVDEGVFAAAGRPEPASLPLHFLLGLEVDELERAAPFEGGPGAARSVDLVLGVQGWRRFAWRDPVAFAGRHPGDGPRVEPVALASTTPVRLDNREAAEAGVARALSDFDGTLAAWGVGFLSVLLLAGCVALVGEFLRQEIRRIHVWVPIGILSTVVVIVVSTLVSGSLEPERHPPFAPHRLATAHYPEDPYNDGEYIPEEAKINISNHLAWRGPSLGGPDGPEEERIPLDRFAGGPVAREVENFGARPAKGRRLRVREFAVTHRRTPGAGEIRTDFTEVLHWDPLLRTGADGRATFSFDTSDSITSFRVQIDGHGAAGRLGAVRTDFRNRVPFFLEPKIPFALSAGDRVDLPVVVANDTAEAMTVTARVAVEGELLRAVDGESRELVVSAGTRGRTLIRFEAAPGRGVVPLSIEGRGPRGLLDRSARTLRVEPRGYPVEISLAGTLAGRDEVAVEMPDDFVPGSISGSLRLYPSVTADLLDGLEALLGIPHGCFEQVSSTNYPNVLALDVMQETGNGAPEAVRRAKGLLADGYGRLVAYECRAHGYEWWGKDPGHEVLTAYGLLQFTDMKRLMAVDDGMLARTREWLLGRRDGKGGFTPPGRGLDGFASTPEGLRDAYILWALSESEPGLDLAPETARMEERARTSDDPYLVALAARTLANRGLPAASPLRKRLAGMQGADGGFHGTTTSVTGSGGSNLDVETTALAAMAFLKDRDSIGQADAAVRFLVGRRQGGGRFGSTQATVLALRAIVEHSRASRRTATAHDLEVLVNGTAVARRHIEAGEAGVVVLGDEVVRAFRPGANRLALRTSGSESLPWSLVLAGSARVPPSNAACSVEATVALAREEVVEGEVVSLAVEVRNRTDRPQPMTVARIGLPAGLEPRAEQLAALLRDGGLDFWETGPREVTAYFRGLRAGETRRFTLELIAAIPGEFEAPPTSTYLYYTDDLRSYAAPVRVVVKPASTDR
jgi:hypothetical protein